MKAIRKGGFFYFRKKRLSKKSTFQNPVILSYGYDVSELLRQPLIIDFLHFIPVNFGNCNQYPQDYLSHYSGNPMVLR